METQDELKKYLTSSEVEKLSKEAIDVIVVGSGVGGMTTAALLAKAGKLRVVLLDKHKTLGGCTHTFKSASDVEFDVGVHYVGGNIFVGGGGAPLSMNRKFFDYITDAKLQWKQLDDVYDVAHIAGKRFEIRTGVENQKHDLKRWFPGYEAKIDAYWIEVEKVAMAYQGYTMQAVLSAYAPSMLASFAKPLLARDFYEYADKTVAEALDELGIDDKLLRAVLVYDYGNYGMPPRTASWANHCAVASHYVNGSAYPVGGSSEIARNVIRTLLSNGGHAYAHAKVQSLLFEQGKVQGVVLHDKKILRSKYVVSAVGGWNTFNSLIDDTLRAKIPALQTYARITNELPPSPSHVIVFAELEGTVKELRLPASNTWILNSESFDEDEKVYADDDSVQGGGAANPNMPFAAMLVSFPAAKDPTWSSKYSNVSTCEIIVSGEWKWFSQWASQPTKHRDAAYVEMKQRIGKKMIDGMLIHFPQLKGKIRAFDVGTPLSGEFNLNSHLGVSYGIACTPAKFRATFLKPSVDELPGLYLTGQDIISEGIQGALVSGIMTASSVSFKAMQTIRGILSNPTSSNSVSETSREVEKGPEPLSPEAERDFETIRDKLGVLKASDDALSRSVPRDSTPALNQQLDDLEFEAE